MQERVYHTPIQDVAGLRQKAMSTSAGFQLSVVNETIDQWQKDSMLLFVQKEVISISALLSVS